MVGLLLLVLERVREWLLAHTGRECPRQHTEHVIMMMVMMVVVDFDGNKNYYNPRLSLVKRKGTYDILIKRKGKSGGGGVGGVGGGSSGHYV